MTSIYRSHTGLRPTVLSCLIDFTIDRYTVLLTSIYIILTVYQLYRGFYSHGGMDDHITILHQLTLYFTYPTLLFGRWTQ